MDTARRGNYNSGEDFVLEYGELRFTFNEADFRERCEQAAVRLGFVGGRLDEPELEDLVNLAVNGEILDPASALGEHVNDCWPELVGPPSARWCTGCAASSSAAPGSTSASARASSTSASTTRPAASPTCSPDPRGGEPIELAPEPSWGRVAYRLARTARRSAAGRRSALRCARPLSPSKVSTSGVGPLSRLALAARLRERVCGASRGVAPCACARAPAWRRRGASSSGRSVPLSAASSEGNSPSGSRAITVVSPPIGPARGRDHGQRAGAAQVARRGHRACARRPGRAPSRVSISSTELPPRSAIRRPRSAACSTAASCASARGGEDRPLELACSSRRYSRELLRTHADREQLDVEPLGRRERRGESPQQRALARCAAAPAITTREPRPNGGSAREHGSRRERRTPRSGSRRRSRRSACRPRPRSAATPLIVSMRTSDAWRSERRAGRTGPLMRSPATSSQRRACAAEM